MPNFQRYFRSYLLDATIGLKENDDLPDTNVFGKVPGTTTNDNAAAGDVGELISSVVTSSPGVSLSTGTTANVTSVSLTAGDWEVDGVVDYTLAGATTTLLQAGASSTSATLGGQDSTSSLPLGLTTSSLAANQNIPKQRFSLSATTTIYLVTKATFSAGTVVAYGTLRARRVR